MSYFIRAAISRLCVKYICDPIFDNITKDMSEEGFLMVLIIPDIPIFLATSYWS